MRKNYMKSLTLAAFVLALTACGNSDDTAPETEDAAAEAQAEQEAEVQAAIDAEREALLNVGKDREDDAEEDIVEEEDTSDESESEPLPFTAYPKEAESPEFETLPSVWRTDRLIGENDYEYLYTDDVANFDTFKASVYSILVEPNKIRDGNAVHAKVAYHNYETTPMLINDIFKVYVDGYELENIRIDGVLGEPLNQMLLGEHEDSVILTAWSDDYELSEDDLQDVSIHVHSPFNPESFGEYAGQ